MPAGPSTTDNLNGQPKRQLALAVSEWIGIVIYLALAFEMYRLWVTPLPADIARINLLALLMGFEFIMVHSAVFMLVMPRKKVIWFLIPTYAVVALALNSGAEGNAILFLYLGLMASRLRFMFSTPSAKHRKQAIKHSIIAAGIYFFSIAVIAGGETSIPQKGLTTEFLTTSGYFDALTVYGIFTENPHLPLVMGIIYFGLMSVVEAIPAIRSQFTRN